MRPRTFYRLLIVLIALAGVMAIHTPATYAQPPGPNSCPALVDQALEALADNCQSTDRNSTCYGYDRVGATFNQTVDADFFSQPADQAGLTTLQTLETAALDVENNRWGIAVMNVQANIPGTLPGQAVTFLLLGDASVENEVPAGTAFVPGDGIEITLQADATIRSAPMPNANVVRVINAEETIEADVRDESGDWVRVLYNDLPAWVQISEADGTDINGLPQITPETRSPMQAFYFNTGIGASGCNQAPDVLTVQSPQNITVDLTMNGVDVRIGSIIDFRTIAEDQISVTVRRGTFEILDDDGDVVETVIAGQTITANTEADGTITEFADPRPASAEELAAGAIINRALAAVRDDTTLVDAQGRIIHIVIEGETLEGIAQLYEADTNAIVEVNSIDPAVPIVVDDQLVIPDPGSGFVELTAIRPAEEPQAQAPPPASTLDCAGFQATFPLDGLAYGSNRFTWNPPNSPGDIDTYRVVVYNNEEPRGTNFETGSNQTALSGTLTQDSVGGGFNFGWEVQALVDGEVACVSDRVNMQRASAPVPPPPPAVTTPDPINPPTFSAGWFCDTSGGIIVFYDGALTTDIVTLEYFEDSIFNQLTGNGPSGEFFTGAFTMSDAMVSTSSNQGVLLTPGFINCM